MSDDIQRAVREAMEPLRKEVEKLNSILTGDDQPERGIIVRFDRVEQQAKSAQKAAWIAIGVLIMGALAFTGDIIRRQIIETARAQEVPHGGTH